MDAGQTVCNDNPRLSAMMETIGKKLNLKKHAVGNPGKNVWTSIDTEGHLGRDGRFYIIGKRFVVICGNQEIVRELSRQLRLRRESSLVICINCLDLS
jgi:hypothetical protein